MDGLTRRRAVAAALAASAAASTTHAAAAPAATPKPLTIAWGGDVNLGSSRGLPPDGGRPQIAAVADALRAADLAAVNLEGTFGTGGPDKCAGGRANCFAFQAPPANAATLAEAGVDVVNQANNHAYDFGPSGYGQTRAALGAAGVAATGGPGEITVLLRGGRRIALVGFSTYGWSAPMSDPAAVRALVRRAARQAPIVVAFLHAGAEGADKGHLPAGREQAFGEDRGDSRAFARTAIAAGADLVLGSGPHVLRGVQLLRGRLAAYSLGNLTGWKTFSTAGASGVTALLTVRVDPDGAVRRARVRSLRLDGRGVPHADPARTAERTMRRLSAGDFGPTSAFSARLLDATAGPLVAP